MEHIKTARVGVAICLTVLVAGCITAIDPTPFRKLENTGGVFIRPARKLMSPEPEKIPEDCVNKEATLRRKQAEAQAKTAKVKMIVGSITGALGAVGGTAIIPVKDSPPAALGIGITTAVVTLAGGLTAGLYAPGNEVVDYQNKLLKKYNDAHDAYAVCADIETCNKIYKSLKDDICVQLGAAQSTDPK